MKFIPMAVVAFFLLAGSANADLVRHFHHGKITHANAERNLNHALYVCARGSGKPKREQCKAIPWLRSVVERTAPAPPPAPVTDWVSKQIAAATVIASESDGDPWPNCSDPFDGGSWTSLVNCENSGSWYDSPGYYRCGLQFDPSWERRFGPLCP